MPKSPCIKQIIIIRIRKRIFDNFLTLTNVETACTLLVFRSSENARLATLSPIAHEVYPFRRITSYALLTTSVCRSAHFSGSSDVPMAGFRSRNRTPATLTPDQMGTEKWDLRTMKYLYVIDLIICDLPLESPCSPITHPWQDVGATPNRCDIKNRKREESKLVPEPMTRFFGKPLNFQATYVRMSTGFDTISRMVSGLCFTRFGIMPLKMSVLRWTRSSRLSPTFWRVPAVTMHKRDPAVTEKS